MSVSTRYINLMVNGKPVSYHHYTRYMKAESDLWVFAVGLGDQAVMQQLGEAFLKCADSKLGRIVLSVGSTPTSLLPYRGDVNLWWSWGDGDNYISEYLSRVSVKPDLCLCVSHRILKLVEEAGLAGVLCPLASGTDFKPLGLERVGLGYSGADSKTPEQKQLILNPFLKRSDFEWRGQHRNSVYLSLAELNEWYNSKQVLFGMLNEHSVKLHLLSNRVFECYASGTPLVFPFHRGFQEVYGTPQLYAVEKAGDAERYVAQILNDYPKALSLSQKLSEVTLKYHTFSNRLQVIYQRLREMKR